MSIKELIEQILADLEIENRNLKAGESSNKHVRDREYIRGRIDASNDILAKLMEMDSDRSQTPLS